MTLLLAIHDLSDYALSGFLIISFAGGAYFALAQQRLDLRRLERKLDALLKHHGVELPMRLSPEVQLMTKDPKQKIAAIKLYREENPGVGLVEAKEKIEEIYNGRQ